MASDDIATKIVPEGAVVHKGVVHAHPSLVTAGSPWDVGASDGQFPWLFSQTDTSLTVDGAAPEDAKYQCAMTCLAVACGFLAGIKKYPDTVHDEGWAQGLVTTADYPQIQGYLTYWMKTKNTLYRLSHPGDVASTLWKCLYWGKTALYLRTISGTSGHWALAVHEYGGISSYPFDDLHRFDPWWGAFEDEDYPTFQDSLWRDPRDGLFSVITLDRRPAIANDSRMGP